jgi:8-oxo-dGTP diphosphatase
VTRLVSSPYERCVQTLLPLAQRLGLPVERRDELAEGEPRARAMAVIVELAEAFPILATHGDVVGEVCGEDAPKKKGSIWVLEVEGTAVTPARYLAPPG